MDEQSKTILTLIVVLVLLVGVAVGKNAGIFAHYPRFGKCAGAYV